MYFADVTRGLGCVNVRPDGQGKHAVVLAHFTNMERNVPRTVSVKMVPSVTQLMEAASALQVKDYLALLSLINFGLVKL